MKRTGIDKICTYLEEKKLSVEEVIRIAFYAGNLEGNKEIIVADEEAEMSLVADVSEDVIRASHNQHTLEEMAAAGGLTEEERSKNNDH